jgi:hypothetical protein
LEKGGEEPCKRNILISAQHLMIFIPKINNTVHIMVVFYSSDIPVDEQLKDE